MLPGTLCSTPHPHTHTALTSLHYNVTILMPASSAGLSISQSQGSPYSSSPRPGSGLPQNKNSLYWHLSVEWTGGNSWQCRKSGSERGEPHSGLWPLTPGKLAPRCRTQFACLASDREHFSVCYEVSLNLRKLDTWNNSSRQSLEPSAAVPGSKVSF